jgi:cell division protein FtsI (penicillin-binding protein 3)
MLYNAVANNGKMMKPYLVSAIKEHGVDVKLIQPEVLVEKICSNETLIQAKECLRAVVDSLEGTAHKKLYDTAYSISGKTGTAVTALDNAGYNKGNKIYQASFIGYFPSEKPVYTMAVVIQNSKESKLIYGADVSGTVFKKIADCIYYKFIKQHEIHSNNILDTTMYSSIGMKSDWNNIFKTMNISYSDLANSSMLTNASIQRNKGTIQNAAVTTGGTMIMPDLKGLGLKDAVFISENTGLTPMVTGKGKVVSQNIAAGTTITKGQKIILMLN